MKIVKTWEDVKDAFDFNLLDFDGLCCDGYWYDESKRATKEYLDDNKIQANAEFKDEFENITNQFLIDAYIGEYNDTLMKLFSGFLDDESDYLTMTEWNWDVLTFNVDVRKFVKAYMEKEYYTRKEMIEQISGWENVKEFVFDEIFKAMYDRRGFMDSRVRGNRIFDGIYGDVDMDVIFKEVKEDFDWRVKEDMARGVAKFMEMEAFLKKASPKTVI